jgi:hypothetical protein
MARVLHLEEYVADMGNQERFLSFVIQRKTGNILKSSSRRRRITLK